MSTRKLSNEEVSALIDGLNDGSLDVGTGVGDVREYRPFVFGADDAGLLGDLYTLRLINERLGRQMRSVLLPMLRFSPRISTLPPETRKFENYLMGVDSFLSLNTARVDALKGTILMTIPPRLVSILVNTFFGGNGDSPVTRASEFTPTEERVIQIVVDGSLRALEDAWRDIYPVNFEFMNSEMNPAFTSFVEGSDQVVVCSFVVQLPFSNPATIDILYPLQVLKQVAPLLRSKIQRVGDGRDEAWERKLREGLLAVELNFSPRLAEPVTNIGELLNIKAGSIIEIPAFEQVKIYVEGQPLFNATIGERDGKMAVRIAG